MKWQDFAGEAPELAQVGRRRLETTGLALLGTLRKDGSPRISPIEPVFAGEHLLLGLLSSSHKAADLRRDPRCTLLSVVTDPDGSEGEFRLHGRAVVCEPDEREAAPRAWWRARDATAAVVVWIDIGAAAHVSWDLESGQMTVVRWDRDQGSQTDVRPY